MPQSEEEKLNNGKVWIATWAWAALWVVVVIINWSDAKAMDLNEWGDFFAGVFAPLAFLWLIVGYYQQARELGQNTAALIQQAEALNLQVVELQKTAEQQKELASVSVKQHEFEVGQAEAQRRKDKLAAQPVFIYRNAGEARDDRGPYYNFYIDNQGAKITNVQLSVGDVHSSTDGFFVGGGYDRHEKWDHEQVMNVPIMDPARRGLDVEDVISLNISYVDGLAEREEDIIRVCRFPDGLRGISEHEYNDFLGIE